MKEITKKNKYKYKRVKMISKIYVCIIMLKKKKKKEYEICNLHSR